MGSDLERDGMFLELSPVGQMAIAEVFYSDITHQFAITLFKESVPTEAISWLIAQALERLPARA